MGIRLELQHRTAYRYDKPISLGPQLIQLRPAPHGRTPVSDYALAVTPAEHRLRWQFDSSANHVARLNIPGKTAEFIVDVTLVADMTPINAFDFLLDPSFAAYPFHYPAELAQTLAPCLFLDPVGPRLQAFVNAIPTINQGTVAFLSMVAARVRNAVGYVTRMEHGVQTCETTLTERTGSCRDSAWLLVQSLRCFGLAARFVSGYLLQLAAEAGEEGPSEDTADLHAWAEVYLPGAGWVGLDPTSGLFAAEGHIPLACAATPAQAAPIQGTVEPAQVDFSYSFTTQRLNETPTLAKPFSDAAWSRVRAVAHAVDRDLAAQDVRLTMGGEPTYVGIDEPESGQWNLEALGPLKRTRGLELLRQLRARTAPGALLHFGQGKWYPGEPLPRWAFQCISRTDGVPVWEDVSLIATEDQDLGFGLEQAHVFLKALTRRLQVSADSILPAFDTDTPTGYILPLRRRQPAGTLAWSSQLWFPRPERLILFPGDSPIGYRITAESVPFVAPDELTHSGELPAHPARHPELFGIDPTPDPLPPLSATAEQAPELSELIRPALCVQAVAGRLHVFLPYILALADYLDLVAAVEDTCAHLAMPVWIEGYPAPYDPRLRLFGLTPDPGVLEVNLPPTATWDELEATNATLQELAHANRLIAGKFAYDGSHLSTGGGSHIVLGAASVLESPILRRPDLLRSMLTFWQRHPSLAYLFSGMYVGPTSQYPRVDEARVDALYELQVAFSQLTADPVQPWILDGLFRNLLVDVTGNTHRAEFCIDKLYPPEGQGLRAGLLELRAFEMPPHYRMNLLQMLLIRALVAAFWRTPYTEPLIRWEATLHDRFMLPHFVLDDFTQVLTYLRDAGLAFEPAWFRAHTDFRFPRIGTLTAEGVELELRQALEPWNVLAEETHAGGTGRSVDSSLERMQVKITGLAPGSRFAVTCNGRKVPLTPTGTPGEAIAGIRYRARTLNATLHPTIPVHTPLVFDLLDTTTGRAIARCTYFAGPPDGTIHTTRPRDADEAAARRRERFQLSEPPPDPPPPPPDEHNPVFPMTLDLRFPKATR